MAFVLVCNIIVTCEVLFAGVAAGRRQEDSVLRPVLYYRERCHGYQFAS
jgi:hypothetical protein